MENTMPDPELSHAAAYAVYREQVAGAEVLTDHAVRQAVVALRLLDEAIEAYHVAKGAVDAITLDAAEKVQGARMDALLRAAVGIGTVADVLRGAQQLHRVARDIEADAEAAGKAVDAAFERERVMVKAAHPELFRTQDA